MLTPVRLLAGASVLGAVVVALLALSDPAPRFVELPLASATPASSTADPKPADWAGRVRPRLEAMRIPIRGKNLEALLRSVDRNARRFGIDPLAVLAIIEIESEFDPMAVSPRGAMGLMQLRADTARELADDLGIPWLSDDMLLDPDVNVLLGTFYLSRLIERFGDLDEALTAFHDGPGRVEISKIQAGSVQLEYANRVWDAIVHFTVRAIA
ncbi:MAG: lytic transglycosylase domain-containing protein [Acidobacteriia bacterium]|nr:lytic transglycosylase domain-containing protein [Terriglobia bacterium]